MNSRVIRYTEQEWKSPDFRIDALAKARAEARDLAGNSVGRIVIKVKVGRHLEKMVTIDYIVSRGGFSVNIRASR
jgi:hypothetical protein